MRIHPELMIRPDDYEILTLNEDGETYSFKDCLMDKPYKYSLEKLESDNFIPVFTNKYETMREYSLYFTQRQIPME